MCTHVISFLHHFRNDPDLCKKAAKLYSNQIDSKDHVTLAYKALAHYCAKQYEEADKGMVVQSPVKIVQETIILCNI